jgi:hypothetical protein
MRATPRSAEELLVERSRASTSEKCIRRNIRSRVARDKLLTPHFSAPRNAVREIPKCCAVVLSPTF